MKIFTISSVLVSLFCFFLAIFIFYSARNLVQRLWGIFNISVALWSVGLFWVSISKNPSEAFYAWKITYIAGTFVTMSFYHLAYYFCDLKQRWKLLFVNFLGGILILFVISNYFICGIRILFNQIFYNIATPTYTFFIFFVLLIVGMVFFEVFFSMKQNSGIKNIQARYFIFGFAFGWAGGISTFLPSWGLLIYPAWHFTICLYTLLMTYAIFRYRFLDFGLVLTRAGIFIAIYSLVLGIPFVLVFGSRNFLISLLNENWWMIPLIISTILATVGPFVYIYINRKAEARLLKEQKNYQNILRNASKGMIRIKDLKHLLNLIVHVVSKAVRIKNIAIYLFDGENSQYVLQAERGLKIDLKEARAIDFGSSLVLYFKSSNDVIVAEEVAMKLREDEQNIDLKEMVVQLNSLNAALAIPCFLEEKLIGVLILGEKRSKKLYSEDDLAVFSVLANQAALAIENAQFYDEIQRTNEQLIQAEKLATIGTMADGLSHQINNRFHALSLISGDSLDVLQNFDFTGCSEKVKEIITDVRVALEKIQNNVLQGGEVVKGLLKYSRPEDGGFEPTCLIEVLNGAIEMVQYKIKLKEINFIQNIPISLPKLFGSRIQLQEVFFNLIDNAYDAIKERQIIMKEYGYKGKIEISAVCLDGHVEIVIVDNGIGVKEQDRKKLFAPFFTTKASSRKGTGLGLYVIEKIINAHQGKLSVDSNYGVGTHFVMMLPTAKS